MYGGNWLKLQVGSCDFTAASIVIILQLADLAGQYQFFRPFPWLGDGAQDHEGENHVAVKKY